jgi:type IV secretion system protein VirB5
MAALLGSYAVPARAEVPVIDASSLAQLANQLQQMKQEYTATLGIFGSLINTLNPNSLATNLIGSQPLPGASVISQLATGSGNFGNLSGLANQFLQANTVYTPQSTGSNDYNAAMLQKNGNTLAGILAMAQQSITSIQTHITGLTQIQSELTTDQSQANISAIQGRLQAEQANLAAQNVQAQSLQTMLLAQQQAYQLQQDQTARQSADSVVAYYGGTSSATPPAPTLTASNLPTFSTTGP